MTITCFGEYLLRLSPPGNQRVAQTASFEAGFGGAEANVAAALVGFGAEARYVTALPPHPLGDAALAHLRSLGLDCSGVKRSGERLGLYYLEKGADLRPSRVIYDRRHSSFSETGAADYDWEALLGGSDWFFFTGITPAVGAALPEAVREALAVCRANGIRTACDLNYRPTLWKPEEAGAVMRSLAEGLELLVANEEHAALLLNVSSPAESEDERLREIAGELCRRYSVKKVALTLRRSLTADVNEVGAVYYDSETGAFVRSKTFTLRRIVDRVGGGDAFTGGLLYALDAGWEAQKAVDFASAANAFKHSVEGDALVASAEEIARLAASDGTVRMVR